MARYIFHLGPDHPSNVSLSSGIPGSLHGGRYNLLDLGVTRRVKTWLGKARLIAAGKVYHLLAAYVLNGGLTMRKMIPVYLLQLAMLAAFLIISQRQLNEIRDLEMSA